ncbi:MAG: putative porin [Steroidobacteraceae bacterium]
MLHLPNSGPRRLPALLLTLGLAVAASTAWAAAPPQQQDVQSQLDELRAAQVRIAEQQREIEAAIQRLQAQLAAQAGPAAPAVAPVAATAEPQRLAIGGDVRLRGQGEYSNPAAPARNSMQVRARLGGSFAVTDRITLGARLVTGDPDDPNSSDVQLSNFDDDFQISLDQAYLQLNFDDLKVYGGKLPQPFVRTNLVWDEDVSPQGIAAVYRSRLANGSALRAGGMFFMLDEQAAGRDSTMLGVQLGYDFAPLALWKAGVNAAYYDYGMHSVAGGDAGDFRNNRRGADGSYLSDFDLVDVIADVTWSGFGARWPLRLVGDYVQNLGAPDGADTGYGLDLMVGRLARKGDWRLGIGYSTAQTDAVLAAFSHDSTPLGTNYRLQSLTLDYRLAERATLNAFWYHYRNRDTSAGLTGDWMDRLRLALTVDF